MSVEHYRERFIQALRELAETNDRRALAVLRRALGKPPGTAVETYPYIVPYLPENANDRQAWPYFVVAPLFARHPQDWPPSKEPHRPNYEHSFGASLGLLAARHPEGRPGIERRLLRILAAEREELPDQLRHAITLLAGSQVPVSYLQLLRDLDNWDHSERSVQQRWARAFIQQIEGGAEEVIA